MAADKPLKIVYYTEEEADGLDDAQLRQWRTHLCPHTSDGEASLPAHGWGIPGDLFDQMKDELGGFANELSPLVVPDAAEVVPEARELWGSISRLTNEANNAREDTPMADWVDFCYAPLLSAVKEAGDFVSGRVTLRYATVCDPVSEQLRKVGGEGEGIMPTLTTGYPVDPVNDTDLTSRRGALPVMMPYCIWQYAAPPDDVLAGGSEAAASEATLEIEADSANPFKLRYSQHEQRCILNGVSAAIVALHWRVQAISLRHYHALFTPRSNQRVRRNTIWATAVKRRGTSPSLSINRTPPRFGATRPASLPDGMVDAAMSPASPSTPAAYSSVDSPVSTPTSPYSSAPERELPRDPETPASASAETLHVKRRLHLQLSGGTLGAPAAEDDRTTAPQAVDSPAAGCIVMVVLARWELSVWSVRFKPDQQIPLDIHPTHAGADTGLQYEAIQLCSADLRTTAGAVRAVRLVCAIRKFGGIVRAQGLDFPHMPVLPDVGGYVWFDRSLSETGHVMRGHHVSSEGNIVVGKIFRDDEEYRREFWALSVLKGCPYMVTMLDHYVDGLEFPVLVMNVLSGERKATDAEEVKRYMRELLTALALCHERGVIHHDVKRANVLRDLRKNTIALIDFDVSTKAAYAVPSNNPNLPKHPPSLSCVHTRMRCPGTEGYFAPERECSAAIDIYAAGVIFAKFIHPDGEMDLNEGVEADEFLEKYHEYMSNGPIVRSTAAGVRLLWSMLDKDPAKRPSAREALDHPYFVQQSGSCVAFTPRQAPAEAPAKASPIIAPQPSMLKQNSRSSLLAPISVQEIVLDISDEDPRGHKLSTPPAKVNGTDRGGGVVPMLRSQHSDLSARSADSGTILVTRRYRERGVGKPWIPSAVTAAFFVVAGILVIVLWQVGVLF